MAKKQQFDAVFFDLDDTLFNSSLMSLTARKNAIRALKEAGLELDEDDAFKILMGIVKEYGSNYGEHFNRLIEKLGYEIHPKLIAAAVVAYHTTKFSLLRPFPGVILTLLTLMKSMKIGLISDGIKIKQWEKLTYLGIQHFFEAVVINDLPSQWKPADHGFKVALKKLKLSDASRTIYVGNKIETDIIGANRIGMVSILFEHEQKTNVTELSNEEKPNYLIGSSSEITEIVGLKQLRWRF
ncbi:MAG: TIGR02253 family HAD-type hydrolase [Candidatus Heimdallarchaeota archaeon]